MTSSSSEKRCLYEVLGLKRDCTSDEIRSAYRKLALQRHPDKLIKSGVTEAEATASFQELVNAYEVLSDTRERAWYDSHRSQILFSGKTNSSSSSGVPDLFKYFTNSVYSGFSDRGKGFYKVYGDVFDKIFRNELSYVVKLGEEVDLKEAPLFGNSESGYEQVNAFYGYWFGFATVMDFAWVDEYDVMSGVNRKSRRVMEEENKKIRKKARREFNETVRGLAEFVKKRDKRVIDMQAKRNEENERKKEEEKARKAELAREKAERARMFEVPDWAKVEEEVEEEEVEEEKRNELYCVVCKKKFRSDKQWKNHEQSKKHKEKVAELRDAFVEEDGDDEVEGDGDEFVSADEVEKVKARFEGVEILGEEKEEEEEEDDRESEVEEEYVDVNNGEKGLDGNEGEDDDDDDDDDDLVVVSEKGQVACRDYPHSRHLCIKFPFSSTPNQSHCDQCYCYVCDSLAPCVYWGDGSAYLDHCQATDKDEFWKLERQNSKDASKVLPVQPVPKVTDASISIRLPPINLVPPAVHNPVPIPSPAHAYPISSNFGVPNMINQTGTSFLSSRNKYQPSLVSQQLMRTSSCTIPRERGHHNYNLGAPLQRPVFKRTGSAGVPLTTNRYSYSSYRDNYRNPYSQPSVINTSLPFSPPIHTFEEPLPRSNPTFDFSPSFQPSINPESYVENPFLFQPQGQSSLPNYSIPSEASQLVNQVQRSISDPNKVQDIGWSQNQTTHQPAAQSSVLEGAGPTSEPSLATGSGGVVDCYFNNDNWFLNNQPYEPGSVEVPESFGFNEFSPEPAFIDAENGRQHWC